MARSTIYPQLHYSQHTLNTLKNLTEHERKQFIRNLLRGTQFNKTKVIHNIYQELEQLIAS